MHTDNHSIDSKQSILTLFCIFLDEGTPTNLMVEYSDPAWSSVYPASHVLKKECDFKNGPQTWSNYALFGEDLRHQTIVLKLDPPVIVTRVGLTNTHNAQNNDR